MSTLIKNNLFKLSGIALVTLLVFTYGCNNGTGSEVKKDTVVPVVVDTVKMMDSATMKMQADSAMADTSGKGGQAVPPKH